MCSQGILDILEIGQREDFYKELFALNARLDIHIDEERFDKDETFKLLGGDNNLKEKIDDDLFKKVSNCVENDQDQHKSIDIQLHHAWKDFVQVHAPGDSKTDLRVRGIWLLLVIKYARALLLGNPLQENLSARQDALTRFASASLSYLLYNPFSTDTLDLSKESTYLQVLLLLECAACASPEATIGFLNLAESAAPPKGKGDGKDPENVFYEEFKDIAYYFPALIEYNKAVAYTHIGRRDKALESVRESIISTRKILKEHKLNPKDRMTLRLYLELPALHQRADLFNKMQCCFNAIHSIGEIDSINGSEFKEEEYHTTYKMTRARLLEVLCWLDMGDKDNAAHVLGKILKSKVDHELIPKKIKDALSKRYRDKEIQATEFSEKEYTDFLSQKPSIRTDALKLVLQWDLDTWKKQPDNNEARFKKAESYIENLSNIISANKSDRFQRQNLKELAVDWLETFSKIKELKGKEGEQPKHSILSGAWRACISGTLNCLGNNEGWKERPWKQRGNIANEIWGSSFKRLENELVERLQKNISRIADHCEGFFHSDEHVDTKGKECFFKDEKTFFCDLVDFELKVLGLIPSNDTNVTIEFPENENDIYPKPGSYAHRSSMRRGTVLFKYLEYAEGVETACPGVCLNPVKSELIWVGQEKWLGKIDEEDDSKGISACLKEFQNTWKIGDTRGKIDAVDRPVLWLEDYERIISDSDYLKHLEAGHSEQPINVFENQLTGVEFVTLRRWNSFTPEISFSKGGGYFLFVPSYKKDNEDVDEPRVVYRATRLGIVVDPGFDFIHNFFSQGFTLDDIDIVLITHADSDHINDFGGLADLLRERDSRGKGPGKMIYTFLPQNAHKVLNRYITDESFRRLYYDTVLVDASIDSELEEDKDRKGPDNGTEKGAIASINRPSFSLKLKEDKENKKLKFIRPGEQDKDQDYTLKLEVHSVPASHDDHTGEEPGSFGYVLKFTENKDKKDNLFATVGFTGDSQWFPEFAHNFKECDLVCSHMGNVLGDNPENYKSDNLTLGDWEALIRKKNHPYLPGEVLFLEQLRKLGDVKQKRVVVLSEFGEELKGSIRGDICKRFNLCFIGNPKECDWRNFTYQQASSSGMEKNKIEKKRCDECEGQIPDKYIRTIPADVGLRISIRKNMKPLVHCVLCDQFYDLDDVEWVSHGSEEAMFYVCGPCFRSKTRDMRIAKYESILELGRPTRRSRTKR